MSEVVSYGVEGVIGTITINRPDALNALNTAVLQGLAEAIDALVSNPDVRVMLLTGQGQRAFVAGADISEFVGAGPADALAISARLGRVAESLVRSPKPVIAVINGYCLGGGFELALACDLRIASSKAQLGLPEIRLGIMPGGGGTVRLTKIAGSSVARTLAMTGDPISAARGFELGILSSVHEPDDLMAAAHALAGKLADFSPFALAQLKSALDIAVEADTASAIEAEAKAFALCYSTADQEEGASAFLEKRKPVFTGR
jgi:enoyl-CoA hydratase/carnithine racemase